jgi:hypothetical protein
MMLWIIGTVSAIIVVWLLTPGPDERPHRLTARQQRMSDRLVELDLARVVLLAELGMEPTVDELWTVTPPRIEGE